MERGSRKHVLDWISVSSFLEEFASLLSPIPVHFPKYTIYMPCGYDKPNEAKLDTFGPAVMPDKHVWGRLQDWWLVHKRGANTPNWDIASTCLIEGRKGLVLVEAKANWPELGYQGKSIAQTASAKSIENHQKIGDAISEACVGWRAIDPRVNISRDTHYQLSNRLAFAWKLATLGIPVVLVYLGFTGDEGIRDAGAPFADDADWRKAFGEYCKDVVPIELFEKCHNVGGAPVWLTCRSRDIVEQSPPVRV